MRHGTCVFVDGNNTFHSARQLGIQIDYTKLLDLITDNGEYVKAVFYTGSDESAERQRNFLHWMTRNGWRVVKKEIGKNDGCDRKAHLECEIATDMMLSVHNGCAAIVLVSGDEDFAYPLQKIQNIDVKVIVAGFRNSMSNKLLEVADVYIELDGTDIAKEGEV